MSRNMKCDHPNTIRLRYERVSPVCHHVMAINLLYRSY